MSSDFHIAHAETDADILACLPLLKQLRPHMADGEAGLTKIRRQMRQSYALMVRYSGREPVALAGYREIENTVRGRILYIDDLVTDTKGRSRKHGEALLKALAQRAKELDCGSIVLDARSTNVDAHRFYLRNGFDIVGFHFAATAERLLK